MKTFLGRTCVPLLAVVMATSAVSTVARADPIQLNFATVNQSLWGPGEATVYDQSVSIPDPYISGHLTVPSFNVSPTAALLDFLGIGNLGPSFEVSPALDITAGLTAGYHLNSGSIGLNYPSQVVLGLPDAVQSGQSFNVSLAYPNFDLLNKVTFHADDFLADLNATAGNGYLLSAVQGHVAAPIADLITPQAGFTTTSPYAEAYVKGTLNVGASIHGEACFDLVVDSFCPFDGSIDLGSTSLLNNTDILKLSTLTGLSVLGQPILDLSNAHLDIPGGYGSIDFHSPSISLNDDTLNGDGSLSASGLQQFLNAGLDVDQLIPLVGTILHNSVGPFSYDLASVQPTLALTVHQSLVFDPTGLDVSLHFSDPVLCQSCGSTTATRDVTIGVGQNATLLAATVGTLAPSQISVTPTFTLEGMLHNRTYVTLDASLDISALALTAPVNAGPACCDPIPLFSTVIPGLDFNFDFLLGIPSITGGTEHVTRSGNLAQLLQFDPTNLVDEHGNHGYELSFGDLGFDADGDNGFNTFAYGTLVQTPTQGPPNCNPTLQCNPCGAGPCDTYFEAAQDVFFGNTDLGRIFCLQCVDPGALAPNPSLVDTDGDPVYFSDLTQYPYLPTAADLLNPGSPYYDVVLANSSVLYGADSFTVTPGGTITNNPHGVAPVPEPEDLWLLGTGLLAFVISRRRAKTLE